MSLAYKNISSQLKIVYFLTSPKIALSNVFCKVFLLSRFYFLRIYYLYYDLDIKWAHTPTNDFFIVSQTRATRRNQSVRGRRLRQVVRRCNSTFTLITLQ